VIGKSVVLSFNGFCNPNGWFASANLEAIRTSRLRAMGIRDKPISTGLTLAEWLCRTADRIDPA